MPGGDGTGPLGRGPLTGRGFGYCSGLGYQRPGYGRPFFGRGFRGYGSPWSRFYREDAADERLSLQRQADFMKRQLRAIEERLKEIESPDVDD
ncbi:MAG: DUF5320 domain-containing protein [Firmicutes bacterium]|nr:DUF5320 domain-containing protein [Bacillota bacterium]